MVEHVFCQYVKFPTHICNNILDIILADDDQIINQVETDSPLGNSDHVMVKFKIAINSESPTQSASEGYYSWHTAELNLHHPKAIIIGTLQIIRQWKLTWIVMTGSHLFVPIHLLLARGLHSPQCCIRQQTCLYHTIGLL